MRFIEREPPGFRLLCTFRGGQYDRCGFVISVLARAAGKERSWPLPEQGDRVIAYRSKAAAEVRVATVDAWRAQLADAADPEAYEYDADMSLIHGRVPGANGKPQPCWVWSRFPLPPTAPEERDAERRTPFAT